MCVVLSFGSEVSSGQTGVSLRGSTALTGSKNFRKWNTGKNWVMEVGHQRKFVPDLFLFVSFPLFLVHYFDEEYSQP